MAGLIGVGWAVGTTLVPGGVCGDVCGMPGGAVAGGTRSWPGGWVAGFTGVGLGVWASAALKHAKTKSARTSALVKARGN